MSFQLNDMTVPEAWVKYCRQLTGAKYFAPHGSIEILMFQSLETVEEPNVNKS